MAIDVITGFMMRKFWYFTMVLKCYDFDVISGFMMRNFWYFTMVLKCYDVDEIYCISHEISFECNFYVAIQSCSSAQHFLAFQFFIFDHLTMLFYFYFSSSFIFIGYDICSTLFFSIFLFLSLGKTRGYVNLCLVLYFIELDIVFPAGGLKIYIWKLNKKISNPPMH